MYLDKNNYPIYGLSEFADGLSKFFMNAKENVSNKVNAMRDFRFNDTVPYRYDYECGNIILEAVVAGYNPEYINVKYNKATNVLKVYSDSDENSTRPWYLNELNLEFTLPETTISDSFVKKIENGVLTINAKYSVNESTTIENPEIEI